MTLLRRVLARGQAYGLEGTLLTAAECGEKWSHGGVELIRTDNLQGGLWLPGDGTGSRRIAQCVRARASADALSWREPAQGG